MALDGRVPPRSRPAPNGRFARRGTPGSCAARSTGSGWRARACWLLLAVNAESGRRAMRVRGVAAGRVRGRPGTSGSGSARSSPWRWPRMLAGTAVGTALIEAARELLPRAGNPLLVGGGGREERRRDPAIPASRISQLLPAAARRGRREGRLGRRRGRPSPQEGPGPVTHDQLACAARARALGDGQPGVAASPRGRGIGLCLDSPPPPRRGDGVA